MTLLNHDKLATCARLMLVAFALSCPVVTKAQQGSGDAQAAAIEAQETKAALEVALKRLDEANRKLATTQESLAESNRVAEDIRSQYEELLLRMASFGVDLVKPDQNSLEQRLLQAVRDRSQAEGEKVALANELAEMSEAVVLFLQTVDSPDPLAQARLEGALASADTALGQISGPGGNSPAARPIDQGQVVSIDQETGLLVVNVGRGSGIRIGMPISVKRDDQPVVEALVVDVRDTISGALIEATRGASGVKVGDRIEPRAEAL